MDDKQFYVVQGWMINKLKLSGNELLVYAIIYGFSQDKESMFNGSLQYIMDCINTSKPTVLKALDGLLYKGLINKFNVSINGVRHCRYKALSDGSKETLPVVKNLDRDSKETLPNNIKNNIEKDIYVKRTRFVKPSIEEIQAYCKERNNKVDAESFYNFYESKGWVVGKSHMKDWKACVRTWERNSFNSNVSNSHSKVNEWTENDRPYDKAWEDQLIGDDIDDIKM